MIKTLMTVSVATLFFSCTSHNGSTVKSVAGQDTDKNIAIKPTDTTSIKQQSIYTFSGDSVVIPPFEIEISLSPKAKERIVNSKETIIVDILLQGTPKDSSKVHSEEDGSFYVASAKREIYYGQVARFDNVKFQNKTYDQLADKDVYLTVNVYTGRKSSKDNLLNVDFLSDKISNIINKHLTLKGKLIYGDD